MKLLSKIFILDDKTGRISTSKIVLWLTVIVSLGFVITTTTSAMMASVQLSEQDIQTLNISKDFLIFFVPTVLTGYNASKYIKSKNNETAIEEEENRTREDI